MTNALRKGIYQTVLENTRSNVWKKGNTFDNHKILTK